MLLCGPSDVERVLRLTGQSDEVEIEGATIRPDHKVLESHPIQRHFQDIHVISQHLQARRAHYELVGRYWLGLGHEDARF